MLDPLTTLNLEFRPAVTVPQVSFDPDFSDPEPRLEGIAALSRMDLFVPRLTGEISVTAQYLELEAYTVYGPRFRVGLSTMIGGRKLQLAAGAQLWILGFTAPNVALDTTTIAALGLDHDEQVIAFDQSAVLDLRDDVLNPKRGFYAEIRMLEGIHELLGDYRFVQATPDVRGYVPLGHRFVVSARAKVGVLTGETPVSERYYGGGAASNRGFAERQLSPHASAVVDGALDSVVIGGNGLIDTSIELRAKLGKAIGFTWYGAAFLDGGDVTNTASELSLHDLYWAIGPGVRAVLGPIPVRIDVGYRLNRTGADDPLPATTFLDKIEFHLGIGQAF